MISRRMRLSLCLAFVVLLSLVSASAQQYGDNLLKGMQWRQVGPFRGGRVLAVTGIPGDPYTYYFGGVGGGVWRTTDGGMNWSPLFDRETVSSIGAIAVSESNPSVIYVGTGESCIRGNISYGNGMYKSTDRGKTWIHIGLENTQHIAKVLINPRNPDVVYVAAFGHAYGPNPDRGVYRSTDGGKTWDKILYKDDKTGAIDLTFDPHNPNVLFAALYEAQRTPWSLSSGGPGSGLYRSVDGGNTWKHLEGKGLPSGIIGRIGVSVSGADSNRVYALIEAKDNGLYRSDDGGDSWAKINDDQRLTQRAWYFTHIFADPRSVDTVYMLNTGMFRSTDGGKTLNLLPAPHGDHHGLWIDPTNPNRMINGNDGGATISVDAGKSWSTQYNQPTAQFYHVAADSRPLYYIYGAQQDNSTVAIASRTDEGYIGRQHWYDAGGGESGYIAPDPNDYHVVYAGGNAGSMTRLDTRIQQLQDVSPWPVDSSGHGAKDLKYRGGWTEPIMFSPNDANVIYTAAEVVFKSNDQGRTWAVISPDLTRNDRSKQESSGGPLTKDNTSVEFYDTVFTLAESPVQKDVIWAGTDDGLIQVTKDGGKSWNNVTPKGMPEWSLVSIIEASPHAAGTAYAAVDTHKLDDLKPYIYKTTDFGKSWTLITTGIPAGAYTHAVREDPKQKGLLYAGTETGIFISWDDGAHWQTLQLNLPQSPIHDLIVKNDDLVVATHGRSFWILDSIAPLRQLGSNTANEALLLFKPDAAYRYHWPEFFEHRQPVGASAPSGAVLYYYFKDKPKGPVSIDILDAGGKVLRNFSSEDKKKAETPPEWPDQEPPSEKIPAEAGMNRFVWDLRLDGPHELPGEPGAEFRDRGPMLPPGKYQVRLSADGKTATAPIELIIDQRVKASPEDIQKSYDLALKVQDQISDIHDAVREIRETRTQLHVVGQRLNGDARFKQIATASDGLNKKMTPLEEQLLQVNAKSSESNLNFPVLIDERLHGLAGSIDGVDAAPTRQQYEAFESLSTEARPLIAQWNQIKSSDLVALNDMMRKDSVPVIYIAPASEEGQSVKAAGQTQQ
jgi:photosystem II stability/assembly factor-like uncharacterized protein